jgi:integrase
MTLQIDAFLADYQHVYAEGTYTTLSRQLRKIDRQLSDLRASGAIISADYSDMTAEDVKTYGIYLRNRALSQSAIVRDLGALRKMCNYCGCPAVDRARAQYPLIFYAPGKSRLPPLSYEDYAKLMATLSDIERPYPLLRAAASVAVAVGAGLRPVEVAGLRACDISLSKGLLTVYTVKGGLTYGKPRTAPIRPEIRPVLARYMAQRAQAPLTVARSEYLFCNPTSGGPLASNTFRVGKSQIESLAGLTFDYRMLRRTYAQLALDEGAQVASVSLVLGHTNTRTTEDAYGRIRPDMAIADITRRWSI